MVWALDWGNSAEKRATDMRISKMETSGHVLNPARSSIYKAFKLTPQNVCKVIMVGQDPYPNHDDAMGLAFSAPKHRKIPRSLSTMLLELMDDYHLPPLTHPDLTMWARQGVLLWNCVPVCIEGKSLSCDWPEWSVLMEELLWTQGKEHCVFVFFGARAREYTRFIHPITPERNILEYAHPSRYTLRGTRLFSTINARLVEQGDTPIDWAAPWFRAHTAGKDTTSFIFKSQSISGELAQDAFSKHQ